ncbi:MAG: hypothetical protein IPH44_03830 [Myxococcales bacterium]|nr:hypothetical protein [Myxococcales bacterium]MBK7197174.1 hypothetical protein [Myxococcales bacterium]MBP6845966.1 hypothetical protein [Kofleriaceae bacterium]
MRIAIVVMLLAAAGAAHADDGATRGRSAVAIPVLATDGAPGYCTRNLAGAAARPDVDGGYRLVGLAPGRYTVTLVMAHEHIDVLLTVPADGEVIVPPVIVRDRCHSIAVAVRGDTKAPAAASWALRYGRNYRAAFGVRADESGWLSAAKLHRRR